MRSVSDNETLVGMEGGGWWWGEFYTKEFRKRPLSGSESAVLIHPAPAPPQHTNNNKQTKTPNKNNNNNNNNNNNIYKSHKKYKHVIKTTHPQIKQHQKQQEQQHYDNHFLRNTLR